MITQDQIGPKLPPIDHSTDEKQFLESKKEVGSNVLDEPWEKQSSAPITWLGPIIQENNYSPSKFASQKRSAVYLSAAEIKLNNHKEIKSPTTAAINRGEKKKQIVNLFSVFKRAKTFVVKVKRNIFFKNYRNMTQWQKNILNDATVFADRKRKKRNKYFRPLRFFFSLLEKSCQFHRKCRISLSEKIKPLNPDIKIKKMWDIFLVVLSFINFFVLSLEMCFFIDSNTDIVFSSYSLISTVKILNFLCYGFDIILHFFTGYHVGGTLVLDLRMIRIKYFESLFFYDLLAFIPCFLYFIEQSFDEIPRKLYLFNLLFLFILKKYSVKLKEFKEFLIQKEESYENWFSIAILYLRTVVISHFLACLWYIVGTNAGHEVSWVDVYNHIENDWMSKYLNSLYWSLVTMSTVGYGDIVPQNQTEKGFCIFTILVGFTLFGFTMGSFGDIIRKMNAKYDDLE